MLRCLGLIFSLLGSNLAAQAMPHTTLPHYDLEMTSVEYQQAVRAQEEVNLQDGRPVHQSPELDEVFVFGRRNLDWVAHINKNRKGQPPISLSDASTQEAFPIESPRNYNAKIVRETYDRLVTLLPVEMRKVLVENAPFTDAPPIEEKKFIEFGLLVDRVYQLAARWRLMEPYLFQLSLRKKDDVRGYYFLSRLPDLQDKLDRFSSLPQKTQDQLTGWLMNLCLMRNETVTCRNHLEEAKTRGSLWNFYSRYEPSAREKWQSYFVIPQFRRDVQWNEKEPLVMRVPFAEPRDPEVVRFLRLNIEDEWRWKDWSLKLDFVQTNDPNTTRIEFKPGVTPNVNDLSGSIITMDANTPLTEYNVQWTIRHEYGHTLGFPDCYLEFYDNETGIITSYQFDVSNLMCSRRGHLNDGHFQELKRVYFK